MTRFLLTLAACLIASAVQAGDARSYEAGKFAFEIGKVDAGWIQSVEGGGVDGEVVTEPTQDYYAKKHIGNVKYEDFALATEVAGAKPINDWIRATLEGKHTRRSGAISAVDFHMVERRRVEFQDALLTEIGFPACDAAVKDPAVMNLKFSPEITRWKPGDGAKIANPDPPQHRWRSCDFMLTIPGLDCTKVAKIDALTVRQSVTRDEDGEKRDYHLEPGKLEFPNLVITLPDGAAESWLKWHQSFVVEGDNGDDREKTGTLVYLDPTRQKELCTLTLHHLGIFKLTLDPAANDNDKIHRVTVEMYCERMTVAFPSDDDQDPPKANGDVIKP
jgi:hypothetical protein